MPGKTAELLRWTVKQSTPSTVLTAEGYKQVEFESKAHSKLMVEKVMEIALVSIFTHKKNGI